MKYYEAFGESKTILEWSKDSRCVVPFGTLNWRISHEWSIEDALLTHRFGFKDLTGKQYGYITVIKQSSSTIWRNIQWECRCICGTILYITSRVLNAGQKKHCGCKGFTGIIPGFMYSLTISREHFSKRNPEVSYEYLCKLWEKQEGKCALTGEKLSFGKRKSDSKNRTASLDRIDSTKGYVEGNIQWVHKWINLMKLDFSQEEFINMCRKVTKYNDKNKNGK